MRVVNSWIVTATMVSGLVLAADPGSSTTLAKVHWTLTKESVALKGRGMGRNGTENQPYRTAIRPRRYNAYFCEKEHLW
jgi:hypothetical protein